METKWVTVISGKIVCVIDRGGPVGSNEWMSGRAKAEYLKNACPDLKDASIKSVEVSKDAFNFK